MTQLGQRVKYTLFSLLPAILLFSLLEVTLRVSGFYYSDTPLMMARVRAADTGVVESVLSWNNLYGTKKEGVRRMVKDSKQLWVAEDSFEKKYPVKKPDGMLRVITLGDSCTAICIDTESSYPSLLQEVLSARQVEVINAGVGSHSSFQGLQRLKYSVLKYHPDILTVYYGWNDHWITSTPDQDVRLRSDWEVAVLNVLEQWRTYQAYHYLLAKLMHREGAKGSEAGRPKDDIEQALGVGLRVPHADYAKNLEAMIDIARAKGIRILLLTAPSDLSQFPGFSNFPFPKEVLIPVHERYNEVVREVAGRRGVPVLDLAAIVAAWSGEHIISADGIHFTPFGCRFAAERLAEKLRELQWVP